VVPQQGPGPQQVQRQIACLSGEPDEPHHTINYKKRRKVKQFEELQRAPIRLSSHYPAPAIQRDTAFSELL
jgi:hypothetical protein